MGLLTWIIFGALAGWLASMFVGTNHEQGAVGNIILGVIGAVVGGFLFEAFGSEGVTGFNFYSLLVAVVGAVVLLGLARFFRREV